MDQQHRATHPVILPARGAGDEQAPHLGQVGSDLSAGDVLPAARRTGGEPDQGSPRSTEVTAKMPPRRRMRR